MENEPNNASHGEPLLEVRDIRFRIPERETPLFDGVDLSVKPGESVVILGGSGVGKSTLAAMIFGLRELPGLEGTVACTEDSVLLLQEGAVFDHLSVGGNIRLVLSRRGLDTGDESVQALLGQVNLEDVALDTPAHTLSGGQKRRLALARALATHPSLFYFDEPSAGLDIDNVRDQADLIRGLQSSSEIGIVVVTHDPLLAAIAGDRVVLLEDGRFHQIAGFDTPVRAGNVDEVRHRQTLIEDGVSGRLGVDLRGREKNSPSLREMARTLRSKIQGIALFPGDVLLEACAAVTKLPGALVHVRDFQNIAWRSFGLSTVSGLLFFSLIGAIIGAIMMVVLKLASPLPFDKALALVGGTFIGALTPPLMGFLYAARSGSAVTAWLGGMGYSRQIDAMKTLRVDPESYLRVPVWWSSFLGFIVAASVFLLTMWIGAAVTAGAFFGVADAFGVLQPTMDDPEFASIFYKLPTYALLLASVFTIVGMAPKRTSEDVATGITRAIIIGTVLVTLAELVLRLPALGI